MTAATCGSCRFFSEMIAQSNGAGVQAVCLCDDSPHHLHYTDWRDRCSAWKANTKGAIDDPRKPVYDD